MTLEFKHFDTRLNTWIHVDGDSKNPESILTEKLDNTLLEFYFPDKEFSFGHLDEYSTPEDLKNHPNGHTLLLSSKTRLLYGSPECLEVIDKLCPDRKDRGAYGSIFLGSCKNSLNETLNILVVNDDSDPDKAGENGGILKRESAFKLVGDCYGQISTQLYDKLTKREEQQDYRVIQHRFGWREGDGEDTKYRFGKGTLRPHKLDSVEYVNPQNEPKIDLILPLSSFKGTDKDRPGGAIKPQIQPGLYTQKIWLGEKSQSERGKTAISQLLASFPQGIKDFAEELEAQAQKLAESQSDPRKVAQLFCEKYEKRKAFTEEQKASLEQQITEQVADGSLVKQLELLTWNEAEEQFEASDDLDEGSQKDDLLMYKLIKADLVSGHNQILETEKVRRELAKFVQGEWRDIALGGTLTFDRAMIISSKELKNGEICVPWLDEGEKVLNFRSPFLNSNGLCVSTNKLVDDRLGPDGEPLKGIIVVNDEDLKRIKARLQPDEIAPLETESERQGRDFDGDCIGVTLARKYPNLTAEAEYRNQPENAYAPTVKEKKQSFYINGEQPPFEEIAIHMSDGISVGIINNQVTSLLSLESEIEILKTYGTSEQKSAYLDRVLEHYEKLLEEDNAKPIREEYKPNIQEFVKLAQNPDRTPESIEQAMDKNRILYRKLIEEACYHNQVAVDLFKSSRKPEMDLIKENNRYLYRKVDYVRDKKSTSVYLDSGIKTTGYSPVELLINQTNKYFQESKLESRPIVQFSNLFKDVEFTPQQRFSAIAAKYEFDRLYNAAVAMERRRETERGPSAIIQTQQGTKLEMTNLLRHKHPGIWKAESINLKLVEDKRSNKLLAIAQINNEQDDNGNPKFRRLGTISPQSIEENNLKPGMTTNNAKLVEFRPELTKGQTRLMFSQAYKFAQAYCESIPESERLSAAAAAWSVGAARQDELESIQNSKFKIQNKSQIQKKTPNFVFAAFSEEIISRLGELQFTDLRVGTLSNEANNFKGKEWNPDEKYNVEIRASDHPPGHDRYASRLVFVADGDGEYKEFAALEPRTAHLPIGTKAQTNILPGETSTAKATVSVPGQEPVEFTIREIKKFSYADKTFHGEQVSLEIGKVPVPTGVVKIKLDGKTLGELDADSIKQLQAVNYLADGKPLNLKLTTISEKHNAFVIAESPNGNFIKIDKTNSYDYEGEKFADKEYRKLTLEVPQSQVRDAVFLNGEPLGVLFFNKDKEAIKNLGALKFGQLTPVNVTLQSNFTTTMVVKVDPATVQYPETWVKQNQVFGQQTVNEEQHRAIAKTAPMLYKIKERPTMLFATPEDKMLGLTQLAVDNHKIATVTEWLADKNVAIAQVPPEDVPLETKKGLAVFNLVNSSISEPTFEAMAKKFGSVIESQTEYEKKVRSLPDRPKHLKPPQPLQTVTLSQTSQLQQPSQTSLTEPKTPPSQESQSVSIDHLRSWYIAADGLGKPDDYKKRIVEVANNFKAGGQLSPKALAVMEQDTLTRISQVSQKLASNIGQLGNDGTVRVTGKTYDLALNSERKDLAIA
ncbi:hypothetical protein, partial [Nostoc sp. FACHB-190]|uniref:hypothetical protein n=1 Tax=Nostoc sp. FACHB-190 TaxID=2692838 RepID=UPI0016863785